MRCILVCRAVHDEAEKDAKRKCEVMTDTKWLGIFWLLLDHLYLDMTSTGTSKACRLTSIVWGSLGQASNGVIS